MGTDRISRLNAQLQRQLSLLCERHILPALPGVLVTITGVELASNLRNANVFVSVYGPGNPAPKALELLHSRRPILQAELARQVVMKYTPVLNVKLDGTAERAERVMAILQELNLPEDDPKMQKNPQIPEN